MTGDASLSVGVRRERLAPETLRLYASDWNRFVAHCTQRGAVPLPASAEVVIAFMQAPGPGRAARGRRLAAIDYRHRLHGLAPPGDNREVRAALKQARRGLPRRVRAPRPSGATLQQWAQLCPGDLAGRRDRAMLLLLASGLSRRMVVALQAEQIRFTERGVGLTIGERLVDVARGGATLCPARALEEWLNASATRYGPVFRKITRWGTLETAALGPDAVRLILARRGR